MSEHRLAAILFTDIAGYTALMGRNEDKAFEMLRINREIHDTLIKRYNGTLIKEMGDGILASFGSATDAVQCAMEIQQEAKAENIPLKIGIHEGEMVFAGDDVLGDGVNIASRLQEHTDPGGITISEMVYREVKNKPGIRVEFIEERKYKNVDGPVKTFKVVWGKEAENQATQKPGTGKRKNLWAGTGILVLIILAILCYFLIGKAKKTPVAGNNAQPSRDISIAVLPFINMSGDPSQEYKSDGLTDEVISRLATVQSIDKVISLSSVLSLKNSNKTIPEIGKLLKVNTILEGSFRESGNRIRVTAQLIEAVTDKHIWSEIYDRPAGDIFDVQSDIAGKIISALTSELLTKEETELRKSSTTNLEAYNLLKKSSYMFSRFNISESIKLSEQAFRLDNHYAEAYAYYSMYLVFSAIYTGQTEITEIIETAREAAMKSISLDPHLALPHWILGCIYFWFDWDFIASEKSFLESIKLTDNDPWCHGFYGELLIEMGRFREAQQEMMRCFEVSPTYYFPYTRLAASYLMNNNINKSIETCKQAVELGPVAWEASASVLLRTDSVALALHYLKKHDEYVRQSSSAEFPRWYVEMAIAYTKLKMPDSAKTYVVKLEEKLKTSKGSPDYFLAMYYGFLGKKEETMKYLLSAYKNRSPEMPWLKVETYFQFLREDQRYWELYEKIGFKKYDEYLQTTGNQP